MNAFTLPEYKGTLLTPFERDVKKENRITYIPTIEK